MTLDQIGLGERDHRTSSGVQIGMDQFVGQPADRVRRRQLNITGSLGQNDLDGGLIDRHIVVDVVDQVHPQLVLVAVAEHVLVARNVVAQSVLGLPAAKEGKAWTELKLDKVASSVHVRGGNVAIGVSVIDT